MVQVAGIELLILPALALGTVLSLVELYFIHGDEIGLHWLSHGLHALPFMYGAVLITMNTEQALSLVGLGNSLMYVLGAQILVGIIALFKIKVAVSIAGQGKIGESFIHLLIIAALIVAAPYIWEYALADVLGDTLTL